MFKPVIFALSVFIAFQDARAALLGAYSPGNPAEKMVAEIAEFAVPDLQQTFEHPKFFTLHAIDELEKQVVSGMNYKMTLTLLETTTDKKDATGVKLDQHTIAAQPHTVTCEVVVYDQPWTGRREVTSKKCGAPVATR